MSPISIDLAAVHEPSEEKIIIGQKVPASDCGDEAAKWLSNFLLQKEEGFRLVYYPTEETSRKVVGNEVVWEHMEDSDIVSILEL